MNAINIILSATTLNLRSYLRVKEAFFFSFIFPVFLFVLFGLIWGDNYPNYIANLYIGIIAMTIASDALFSVGPIIRIYVTTNTLKTLRTLPFNMSYHFIGLALSRLVAVCISIGLITICAIFLFNHTISWDTYLYIAVGLILGSVLFSFMGLFFSFSVKPESGRGLISMVYFFMLFLSSIFYPVSIMPHALQLISHVLPLKHLVLFMKGDLIYIVALMVWSILFFLLFGYRYKKFQSIRD